MKYRKWEETKSGKELQEGKGFGVKEYKDQT